MKIYRVFDDVWEQVMGEGQVCEFAISQVYNCPDDYLVDNLEGYVDNAKEISTIAFNILNLKETITFEQAKMLLNARCFDLEEIEVY